VNEDDEEPTTMTTDHDVRSALLKQMLRRAMDEAGERSASLPLDSSDRHFFLGVAAAAADEVHPERAEARPDDWWEREDLAFREGFLAMQARIAALVMTAGELPPQLHLPDPER
jgi:hypothetical protein